MCKSVKIKVVKEENNILNNNNDVYDCSHGLQQTSRQPYVHIAATEKFYSFYNLKTKKQRIPVKVSPYAPHLINIARKVHIY